MGLKNLAKLITGYLLAFAGLALWLFPAPNSPAELQYFGFFVMCIGGAIIRFFPTRTVRVVY